MKIIVKSFVLITILSLIAAAFSGCELLDRIQVLFSPAHQHNYVITPGQKPTCTEKGFTRGEHCTECGNILIPVEDIGALGHSWIDADCTTAKTCSVCEATEGEALGHTWTDATCTTAKTCSVCEVTEGDILEHTAGEWIVDIAATAGKDGKRHTECIGCGKLMNEEILHAIGSEGLVYTLLDDGTYTVASMGECTDTEIFIPEYHEGIAVTSISNDAFKGKKTITSVHISEGIKAIGEYAFFNCRALESIDLPSTLTEIEAYAFCQTAIKSIILPDSVTYIGDYTFMNCESLTEIALPDNLTVIPRSAFNGCFALVSVTLPKELETINKGAFSGCFSLREIVFPEKLKSIDQYAFRGCTSLVKAVLPESLTFLGEGIFDGCTSLKEINIPSGVTSLNYTFTDCTSLEKITLSEGLLSISNFAFYNCTSLSELVIPASVTSIVDYVFGSASKLTSLTYAGTVEQWNAIELNDDWNYLSSIVEIVCTDGIITLE